MRRCVAGGPDRIRVLSTSQCWCMAGRRRHRETRRGSPQIRDRRWPEASSRGFPGEAGYAGEARHGVLLTVPLIDTHVLWQDPWVIARIREGVPSLPLQESLPGDQRDAAYVALVTAMAAGASQRDVATALSIKDHKRVGSYLLNVSQQKTGLGSANKKKLNGPVPVVFQPAAARGGAGFGCARPSGRRTAGRCATAPHRCRRTHPAWCGY